MTETKMELFYKKDIEVIELFNKTLNGIIKNFSDSNKQNKDICNRTAGTIFFMIYSTNEGKQKIIDINKIFKKRLEGINNKLKDFENKIKNSQFKLKDYSEEQLDENATLGEIKKLSDEIYNFNEGLKILYEEIKIIEKGLRFLKDMAKRLKIDSFTVPVPEVMKNVYPSRNIYINLKDLFDKLKFLKAGIKNSVLGLERTVEGQFNIIEEKI